MGNLDQTVEQCLGAIGAGCPRLLGALRESPEAVWSQIMRMESACQAFEEACSSFPEQSGAAREIRGHVGALRGQMAKDGLGCDEGFAAFRQCVSAIQRCADRLRNSRGQESSRNNRPVKTCVFYCSNNLDAGRLGGLGEPECGDTVKLIGLPCSGKVDVPYLVKALETGADGVVIVACKKKECRHLEGSLRAHKRAEAVESLLAEIGLGAGRVAVIECAKGGAAQVWGEIRQFLDRVRGLPQERALAAL